mmetsp:Transcript_25568/g.60452  ORF Transcript_25568/g.60452 Transcript_25568/m.60452 type:complete len:511 (-) Transcript_25568:130-1662(-)
MKMASILILLVVTSNLQTINSFQGLQQRYVSIPRRVTASSSSSSSSSSSHRRSHSLTADGVLNIDETAEREIEGFLEWSESCGVQRCNGFELVPTTETVTTNSRDGHINDIMLYRNDISAVTYEDLNAGDPVVWVPNEMILSSYQCYEEFGGYLEDAETLLRSLNVYHQRRHFVLMIKILLEYEKGVESPWFPWLNSLPRYYSNGASMTDFCVECLPPLVGSLVMKERTRLKKMLNLQKLPFLRDDTKNNRKLIEWAWQIVFTRAFDYDAINNEIYSGTSNNDDDEDDRNDNDDETKVMGDLCIVPVVDMFNHGSAETEVHISFDEDGNCLAETTRDVPAGTPLRFRYADPTNPSFLLARYGFLDEYSPATFCKLMYPHVNQQLKDVGYAHNRMLFYHDTGDVSGEVWDVLLYQLLGSANAARRREFFQAHMNGDDETKYRMHEQYYGETSQQLLHHIDMTVLELDELCAKAEGKDFNTIRDEHPRLPLILRHNDFVRETFLRVRSRYFE